jgi:flagellar hook protein FlgE
LVVDYYVLRDEADAARTGATAIAEGDLEFDESGALLRATAPPVCMDFDSQQCVTLDFGSPQSRGGTGLDGITLTQEESAIAKVEGDGFVPGTAERVTIETDGVVSVQFDSGQSLAVGQLAIARFDGDENSEGKYDESFRATSDSGTPSFAPAGTEGRGTIVETR